MEKKQWFLEKKGGSEDRPEPKPPFILYSNANFVYAHSWGAYISSSCWGSGGYEYRQPQQNPPHQYINQQINQMPIRDQGDRGNDVGHAAAYMHDLFPPPRGDEPVGGHAGGLI